MAKSENANFVFFAPFARLQGPLGQNGAKIEKSDFQTLQLFAPSYFGSLSREVILLLLAPSRIFSNRCSVMNDAYRTFALPKSVNYLDLHP